MRLARWLLRSMLSRSAAERALADVEDVATRHARRFGARAARGWALREASLIVLWSWFGAMSRLVHRSERRGSGRRRGGGMLRGLGEDLRFGVRALSRRPGFALLAVLLLALGIGANVTIFTVADRLFLAAPPGVESPDRLVRLFRSWAPGQGGSMSYPNYADLRDETTTLSGLTAYNPSSIAVTARVEDSPLAARAWLVTGNYFDVLGVDAAAGRFFLAEEDVTPGGHAVAVLSYGFWQRAFGGSTDAIGRVVRLNGTPFTVVGVAAQGFAGLGPGESAPDVYVPLMMRNAIVPTSDTAWRERVADLRENWLSVVGRRKAGVSFEVARAELVGIADRLAELYPEHNEGETVHVTEQFRYFPGTNRVLAGITRTLMLVVVVVLAVAAANVAILLLSRASARSRELGIRAAIGAGRSRTMRLLLVESLLLALLGGALGVGLAFFGAGMAGSLLPIPIPDAAPDGGVLLFAAGVSVLTAVLVGTAPAVRAARADVVGLIQDRGRGGRSSRTQSALVVMQVALSLVLVTGAALFVRSLTAARTQDIGFETERTLIARVELRNHGYDLEGGLRFVDDALDRLAAIPGARHVTTTRMVPFQGDWTTTLERWAGVSFGDGRESIVVGLDVVSPGYFEMMGMPIVRGRSIDARDRAGASPVVVANQAFVDLVWPGEDALGRTVPARGPDQPAFTIVGVTRNATYYRLGETAQPHLWAPIQQVYQPSISFLVRTDGDPLTLAQSVRETLHAIDPDVAIAGLTTMDDVFDAEIARFRVTAQLVGLFGVLALALASAGLYGVLAYLVIRRTREIGVRLALGATRRRVATEILRRGLGLAATGIALGLAGAFALSRLVSSMLFDTSATDPVSFLLAPLVLLAVATAAVLIPALRAMAVDPVGALRG